MLEYDWVISKKWVFMYFFNIGFIMSKVSNRLPEWFCQILSQTCIWKFVCSVCEDYQIFCCHVCSLYFLDDFFYMTFGVNCTSCVSLVCSRWFSFTVDHCRVSCAFPWVYLSRHWWSLFWDYVSSSFPDDVRTT